MVAEFDVPGGDAAHAADDFLAFQDHENVAAGNELKHSSHTMFDFNDNNFAERYGWGELTDEELDCA